MSSGTLGVSWVAVVALLSVSAASEAQSPVVRQLDALNEARSEAPALAALDQLVERHRTSGDYEVVWRLARHLAWQADAATAPEERARLGKEAWQLGERACKLAPRRVEGHYFAATGLGIYATGVGVLNAILQGLEGQFNERADAAVRLDEHFLRGLPRVVKGWAYCQLPWPKKDVERCKRQLRMVLAAHPESLRARYYLAEAYLLQGDELNARRELERIASGSTAYDAAEGSRMQAWARRRLAGLAGGSGGGLR